MSKLIGVVFLTMLISCDSKNGVKKELKKYDVIQKVYEEDEFSLTFNFPDTLYRDSTYVGAVFYTNKEYGIKETLGDSIKREVKLIYQAGTNGNFISDEEFNDPKEFDTMYGFVRYNKYIFANEFKFKELGENFINGVIQDVVSIRLDEDRIRKIEMSYRIINKMYVIEGNN